MPIKQLPKKHFWATLLLVALPSIALYAQVSTRRAKKIILLGDLTAISKLISSGHDINTRYKKHYTLLHFATEYGKVEIVKFLVDHGADMNIQNKSKETPLLIATSFTSRNDSISAYLINKGADLNIVGLHGSTALRNTIGIGGYGPDAAIFKLLIEKGADKDFKCVECCDRTPFLYCCAWGTEDMAQVLIDKKVNINQTDCKGLNALMYAIMLNNTEVIKLLIKTGIDKNHKDNEQRTAFDYAVKTKKTAVISLLGEN